MNIQWAPLLTDYLVWILVLVIVFAVIMMRQSLTWYATLNYVLKNRIGMVALVIFGFYSAIFALDSFHFQVNYKDSMPQVYSLLDVTLPRLMKVDEKTYSAPLAIRLYSQQLVRNTNGLWQESYPRLIHAGKGIHSVREHERDIAYRAMRGAFIAFLIVFMGWVIFIKMMSMKSLQSFKRTVVSFWQGHLSTVAWREMWSTMLVCLVATGAIYDLSLEYHVLGTDKIGKDVLYEVIKSIRTGVFIGTWTTLFMLPFALVLGLLAGYFKGWVDDLIQYFYTTLSSIPGVLLISATILVMQLFVDNHAQWFPSQLARADVRLLMLCFVLGLTTWSTLCRLLRGETLKLRSMSYIEAAQILGVRTQRILWKHLFPNVFHIILMTMVLDFSGLVLAESVLTYVGVGVDPTTYSWGNMINTARLELARDPIVWWPLVGAVTSMFVLVLAANLLADVVRDALDPRAQSSEIGAEDERATAAY